MYRYNFPHRKKQKRENALVYWKRQLNKETRSPNCVASDAVINSNIKALEAKLKVQE